MSATNIDDTFNAPAQPAQAALPLTREDVLGALRWGKQQEIPTKKGPRMRTTATATREAIDLFAREGPELYALGYTLGEWPPASGKRQVTKWELVPEKVIVKRQEAAQLSRATDADINVPCPEGLSFLGYQKAGIAFGFERPAVLIGDEMGLGKTPQSVGIINCLPDARRILIICPASLKINWMRECKRFLTRQRTIFIADSKLFPDLADGIVIVNFDVLHRHQDILHSTEYDVLIVDEAHFLKSGDESRRGRMVMGSKASRKEKENGAADLPGIQAKKKIFLTGTPIANRPLELWPLISYLDPITWSNKWKYMNRYCGATHNGFGWDFTGASNLPELQQKLRETILVRRLKKDVLKELPPKRRSVIEFPATGEAARAVRDEIEAYEGVDDFEAKAELATASDNPNDFKSAVEGLRKAQKAAFEGMSRLRALTGEAKIPMIIEHLEESLEESPKIIFFAHHKAVIAAVAKKFGRHAVQLVGDTSMIDRQAAVDRFQKDPSCKLFIGSLLAAGVGITLTASSHVVFGENSFVPGENWQAEDRAHRIGQRDSVLVQYLVLEGSLDATILRRNIAKQEVIEQALDIQTAPSATERQLADGPGPGAPSPRDLLAASAAKMTADQRTAAHAAIRILAAKCNGARDWDGAGFSKIDTAIGKALAATPMLTPMQAALALKIARKYAKTQLTPTLAAALG